MPILSKKPTVAVAPEDSVKKSSTLNTVVTTENFIVQHKGVVCALVSTLITFVANWFAKKK